MCKKNILIQDNDQNFAILCTENQCRFKKLFGSEYKEVAIIKPEEDGFKLQKFSPLSPEDTVYNYVEECLYHILYEFGGLPSKDSKRIQKYFNEI